jgi:hypothetical protein
VRNRLGRGLLVLLALTSLVARVEAAKKEPFTVVSGVVRAATTDTAGHVETIEIMVGEDENAQDPYQVADTPRGQELKGQVGEYVIAAGTVTEDKLGWKTIAVKTYTLGKDLQVQP